MFDANGKQVKANDHLRLHPATDEWMRGATEVRVTSVREAGFAGVYIRHDATKTPLGFKSAAWVQANTVHSGDQFTV